MPTFIELENIQKSFSGVVALGGVDFSLASGEVVALVGENGAGKSTLMKILSGVYAAGEYSGKISIDGKEVHFSGPKDAEAAGIAIIHQELSSFSHLSIAENLFVGHWDGFWVDWEKMEAKATEALRTVGLAIDPKTLMKDLPVGTQQLVEIAKALSRKSRLIILDEPTSALSQKEVETLFQLIDSLRSAGKALVYISHKLDEVYRLADRAVVLRDGKSVHEAEMSALPRDELIAHMVGRPVGTLFPAPPERSFGEVIFEARNYSAMTREGLHRFGPLNFKIRRGEILGLAGLLGAGRSELLRAIMGSDELLTSGEAFYRGKPFRPFSPREAAKNGITFVSEDRKGESIFAVRSLAENSSVTKLMMERLTRLLSQDKEESDSLESLRAMRTKYATLDQQIQSLSGGNQQKVILARALAIAPDLILLDEPTRGVDVGAKYEICEILFQLAETGRSLLVVSSELPELMAISDRVIVLSRGKQNGEFLRGSYRPEDVMSKAVGGLEI